ncbi:MAG TPA: TrmH family RNA methyltransferase [Candidatus Paceibacterota bacterium]
MIKELKRTSPPRDDHLSSWGEVFIISLEQSPRAVPYNKLAAIYRSKFKKHNRNSFPRYTAMALIVGNEVRGISPTILKKSDAVIEIPMYGKKESLNVSVAVGIALFELRKSMSKKGGLYRRR